MTQALPDAGIRGWVINTARQHFWRVASWYEFEADFRG